PRTDSLTTDAKHSRDALTTLRYLSFSSASSSMSSRCIFFFYSYGDHRDLHSFPTRRSSDLRCWSPYRACGYLGSPRRSARRRSGDRKSTRLNSSHVSISYAVFCLKKKNAAVQAAHELAADVEAEPGTAYAAAHSGCEAIEII